MTNPQTPRKVRGGAMFSPARIALMIVTTAVLLGASLCLLLALPSKQDALWFAGFGLTAAGVVLAAVTSRF